jgi:hypothetical protein
MPHLRRALGVLWWDREQWPDAAAVQQRADYLKAALSAAPILGHRMRHPASGAKALEQRRRRRLSADFPMYVPAA